MNKLSLPVYTLDVRIRIISFKVELRTGFTEHRNNFETNCKRFIFYIGIRACATSHAVFLSNYHEFYKSTGLLKGNKLKGPYPDYAPSSPATTVYPNIQYTGPSNIHTPPTRHPFHSPPLSIPYIDPSQRQSTHGTIHRFMSTIAKYTHCCSPLRGILHTTFDPMSNCSFSTCRRNQWKRNASPSLSLLCVCAVWTLYSWGEEDQKWGEEGEKLRDSCSIFFF